VFKKGTLGDLRDQVTALHIPANKHCFVRQDSLPSADFVFTYKDTSCLQKKISISIMCLQNKHLVSLQFTPKVVDSSMKQMCQSKALLQVL